MNAVLNMPTEQHSRENLAALYRLLDRYGMSDLANQEVGARVGDQPDCYLVHPYGLFYEEMTASSLVKINANHRLLKTIKVPRTTSITNDMPMPVYPA